MHRNAKLELLALPPEFSRREKSTKRMAASETSIRDCRKEDLPRIVEIHKTQFNTPGALLGQLSPTLIALLYGTFLDRSIFLVHTKDGEVDGFVLGGSAQMLSSCKWSFLRNHALLCLAETVRRPHLWLRAMRSLVTLIGRRVASLVVAAPPEDYRLLSIAVAGSATRNGFGTALVRAFESHLPAACCTYSLTVLKANSSANRFYDGLAFQRFGETALSWRLRKDLAINPAATCDILRAF